MHPESLDAVLAITKRRFTSDSISRRRSKVKQKRVFSPFCGLVLYSILSTIGSAKMKKSFSENSESSQVRSSGRKLYEIFALVQKQIDFESFLPGDRELAREISMIISEIYWLPSNSSVRIGGNTLTAGMVSEVYEQLRYENIESVIGNFQNIKYPVRHIKSYFRTALYNSVFENEARLDNSVRAKTY